MRALHPGQNLATARRGETLPLPVRATLLYATPRTEAYILFSATESFALGESQPRQQQ